MTSDDRMTWTSSSRSSTSWNATATTSRDNQHTGQAIVLIRDLARIYEGTQDAPDGTYPGQAPPSPQPRARTDLSGKQTRTPSSSPAPTSAPSWPRWTSPPTTSATAPRRAPTAPTSPAPPARPASTTPGPTTRWPTRCSRPPKPPRPLSHGQAESARPPRQPRLAADKEAGQ